MRRRTFLVLVVAAASSTILTACTQGASSVPAQTLLDLINEKRVAHGCAEVDGNSRLRLAATRHVVDILDHPQHFGQPGTQPPLADIHTGTDGSNGGLRIAEEGYSPLSSWGEIVYWAPGPPGNNAQAAINWWMNSPGHRAQIENCNYTHAGVGLVYPGGVQWIAVVNFATH